MQDERGLYYFPDLYDRNTRMYVRLNQNGEVEFRLYVEGKPQIWELHEWLTHDIVAEAANLYKQENKQNNKIINLYDINVAKAVLKSAHNSQQDTSK